MEKGVIILFSCLLLVGLMVGVAEGTILVVPKPCHYYDIYGHCWEHAQNPNGGCPPGLVLGGCSSGSENMNVAAIPSVPGVKTFTTTVFYRFEPNKGVVQFQGP